MGKKIEAFVKAAGWPVSLVVGMGGFLLSTVGIWVGSSTVSEAVGVATKLKSK